MSKILFLHQPSVGHMTTLLNIALQMQEDGHAVHFLLPGPRENKLRIQILETAYSLQETLQRNNISFDVLPPALTTLPSALLLPYKSGYDEIVQAIQLFSHGIDHYTRYILNYLHNHQTDLIVTDFAFPASSIAAEVTKIPYVVIYHSGLPFRGEGIPPFGSGLPIGNADNPNLNAIEQKERRLLHTVDSRLNLVRQKYGLAPTLLDFLRTPYSPWLNLIASTSTIEAPRNNFTPNTFFIGPCFGKRAESYIDFPFEDLKPNRYRIYVSLGTVFNNKPEVIGKIITALDIPIYQIIVSAGGAYETLQQNRLPPNAMLFKHVPQVRLLPLVDLFITHGGNNSTNEALAAGIPMITLPVGGEQGDNASRIVYLGVGKRLDSAHFSEAQLLSAVEEIRTHPSFQARSTQIKESLQKTQGLLTASQSIGWIAEHRKPLQRKASTPLTITPNHLPQLFADNL